MVQSKFLQTFKARGFLHQCTDEAGLDAVFSAAEKAGKALPVYIGFDCTAPSLHVGSLLQIMILRLVQQSGHKPIVLLGGGTTKVGDPSGKDETRKIQTDADIANNMAGIRKVFEPYIRFGNGASDAVMVNNDEWLSGLGYIAFLRDIGAHFSVNKMLSFDSVKLRLEREQNLSFLEFNYMLLQAYDFTELFTRYGCRLQIGGSDQWGNIVNGIDLQRRLHPGEGEHSAKALFGLTTPLITTASGAKMGKTAQGAVWLTADMVSPYDYWQFWRNTEDKDVGRFLRLFTELSLEEIARLETLEGAKINDAKIVLANEATALCHGKQAAADAAETARKTFEQGGFGDALPVVEVPSDELGAGIPAFKLFQLSGLAESGNAAKRLIEGGGGRINDVKVDDALQLVSMIHLNGDGVIKLSSGKKKHALVKVA